MASCVDWLNLLGIGEFEQLAADDTQLIVSQALRFCPTGTIDDRQHVKAYRCELLFYDRHDLVCLIWPKPKFSGDDTPSDTSKQGNSTDAASPDSDSIPTSPAGELIDNRMLLFGIYAEEDFHPLDATGKAISKVNQIAPFRFSLDTVRQYVALRMVFEHRFAHLRMKPKKLAREERLLTSPLIPVCRAMHSEADVSALPVQAEHQEEFARWQQWLAASNARVDARIKESKVHYRIDRYLAVAMWTESKDSQGEVEAKIQAVEVNVDQAGEVDYLIADVMDEIALDGDASHSTAFPHAQQWKRTDGVAFVQQWQSCQGELRTAIAKKLEEKYAYHCHGNLDIVLRFCELPFYRDTRLLEIVDPSGGTYRRGYALFHVIGKSIEIDMFQHNANLIHKANARPDNLQLNDDNFGDYLRFFCWALHGGEGGDLRHFEIPAGRSQLYMQQSPPQDVADKLDAYTFGVRRMSDDEAAKVPGIENLPAVPWEYFRALVTFSSSLNECWFAIHAASGTVTMLSDENLVPRLPLQVDSYGAGDLFTLSERRPAWNDPLAEPTAPVADAKEVSSDPQSPDLNQQATATNPRKEVDVTAFLILLQHHHHVENLRVRGKVRLCQSDGLRRVDGLSIENCEFVDEVTLGDIAHLTGTLNFEKCRFRAGLKGQGAKIGGCLTVNQCRYDASTTLDLTHASITGNVKFEQSMLGGSVDVADSQIGGSLIFRAVQIGADETTNAKIDVNQIDDWAELQGFKRDSFRSIVMDRAQIGGDFRLEAWGRDASVVSGAVAGLHAEINGDVIFGGALIDGFVNFSYANIDGRLSCWLTLGGKPVQGTHFRTNRSMHFDRATIGSLELSSAYVAEGLSFYNAKIAGSAFVLGLYVGGNLDFNFATIHGMLGAFRSEDYRGPSFRPGLQIGRNLYFSGAQITAVEFRSVEVAGYVKAITGRFGRFLLTGGIEPLYDYQRTDEYWASPSRVSALILSAVTIEEQLALVGLKAKLPADRIRREEIRRTTEQGISLTQCKVGSDVTFFDDSLRRNLTSRWGVETNIEWIRPPSTDADAEAFQRELPLPKIPVPQDFAASSWGGIDLQANRIGGKLDLRNMRVEGAVQLNDTHVGLDLLMSAINETSGVGKAVLLTSCAHLDMEKLHCQGDVDLTGLRVVCHGGWRGSDLTSVSPETLGTLRLRGAQVAGEILLLPRRANRKKGVALPLHSGEGELCYQPTGQARIDGARNHSQPDIDLTAAQANHLVLSGDNAPARNSIVSLERGQFSRLEIVEPTPGPVNMTAITVHHWVFGHETEPRPRDFTNILTQMQPFDRLTWIGVEQYLRNAAQDEFANAVFMEMRQEERRRARQRRPKHSWRRRLGIAAMRPLNSSQRQKVRKVASLSTVIQQRARTLPVSIFEKFSIGLRRFVFGPVFRHWMKYGTQPWLLLVTVFLVTIIPSLLIFSNPEHVRATGNLMGIIDATEKDALLIDRTDVAEAEYGPIKWSGGDGLLLALRYHVPIIPAVTHSWWEAGEKELWPGGITAEQYAFLVATLHWVAWPVALIGWAALVFRGKRA